MGEISRLLFTMCSAVAFHSFMHHSSCKIFYIYFGKPFNFSHAPYKQWTLPRVIPFKFWTMENLFSVCATLRNHKQYIWLPLNPFYKSISIWVPFQIFAFHHILLLIGKKQQHFAVEMCVLYLSIDLLIPEINIFYFIQLI